MQSVVRTYSGKGAKELVDVLETNKGEVERLLRAIKGFVGYTMARTDDGGFTVTVCQDKAGIDDSVRVAREWIAKNAANTGVAAPEVTTGSVIVHLK